MVTSAIIRMDKYQKLQRIGEGTYGVVYKAKHREHGTILALKRIRLESEDEGDFWTTWSMCLEGAN